MEEDPLRKLDLNQLRQHAFENYRIPLTQEMTAEDIINAIRRGKGGGKGDFALHKDTFGDKGRPGWAELEMFKDPSPEANNRPQRFFINGYRCWVPLGIPVWVPIKVADYVSSLKEERQIVDKVATALQGNRFPVYKKAEFHRFPHKEHRRIPGPDPRPMMDDARIARHRPREAFNKMFGFWPKREQLDKAIMDGVIPAFGQMKG